MEDYAAKLTGEPFLFPESRILAKFLIQGESIENLRRRNKEENLIGYKSINAIQRVNAPLFKRLATMNEEMLKLFISNDIGSAKLLLLFAIIRTDNFVKDFIYEVYREKIKIFSEYLDKIDINIWYDEKKQHSLCLQSVTESTEYKLKQVLMQIVQGADLAEKAGKRFRIIRPFLSTELVDILKRNSGENFIVSIGGKL